MSVERCYFFPLVCMCVEKGGRLFAISFFFVKFLMIPWLR